MRVLVCGVFAFMGDVLISSGRPAFQALSASPQRLSTYRHSLDPPGTLKQGYMVPNKGYFGSNWDIWRA